MAQVNLPPCGPLFEAERHRELKRIEDTTLDPVTRYQLREARIFDDLRSASAEMVRQAQRNRITADILAGKHID